MVLLSEPVLNNDPLKVLDEDDLAKGGTENADANIFKNLPIIEDMEMSSDCSKRKRNDVGDTSLVLANDYVLGLSLVVVFCCF